MDCINNQKETTVQINYAGTNKKKVIPKMNEQIRQWCIKNNACFRCRTPGHGSSNCTTFPRSTNGGTLNTGTTVQPSATPSKPHF